MIKNFGYVLVLSGILILGVVWGLGGTVRIAEAEQQMIVETATIALLTDLDGAQAAAWVDLDLDGFLDLAYGEANTVRIARNPGDVALWTTLQGVGIVSHTVTHLTSGDLNSDGRPDLVSVAGSKIHVWLNPANVWMPDGTLIFDWEIWRVLAAPEGVSHTMVALTDIDRDGKLDVVSSGSDGVIRFWRNQGAAVTWTEQSLSALPGEARDFEVLDVDNDGWTDIVAISSGMTPVIRMWQNPQDPFGTPWLVSQDLVDDGEPIVALTIGHMDDDRRPDLIVGHDQGRVTVWQQPADLPFTTPWFDDLLLDVGATIHDLVAVDLNRNAQDELLVTAGDPARLGVWHRVPSCTTLWQEFIVHQAVGGMFAVVAGDLERNGSIDVGVVAGDEIRLWPNTLTPSPLSFAPNVHSVGATGEVVSVLVEVDLDNDGYVDVVTGDRQKLVAWRNDGAPFESGWLSFTIGGEVPASWITSLTAGDVDGDGDQDVIAGYRNQNLVVWENHGDFVTWTRWVLGLDRAWITAVTSGDVDGDGALDIVTGGGNSASVPPSDAIRVTVWLNGPLNSGWVTMDVGPVTYTVRSVDLGDLDNDGDLDIAIGTNHAPPEGSLDDPVPREEWPNVYQIRAFRNDRVNRPPDADVGWYAVDVGRDPEFETLTVQYHGYWGANISSIALADLDNDGDLDLVSTDHMEGDFQVMAWENDGTPFTGEETLWRGAAIAVGPYHNWLFSSVLDSAVGDFEGDGDVDVATANAFAALGQAEVIAWENTGIAFHEVVSETYWARHDIGEFEAQVNAQVIRVADFDIDGDLDLVTAAYTDSIPYAISLWENTVNHAPGWPACPMPAMVAADVPLTTTLHWTTTDVDGDLLTYTVAFGELVPPPVVPMSTTANVYMPGVLEGSTTYYWQVTAFDGIVATVGPLWQFSTETSVYRLYLPVVLSAVGP